MANSISARTIRIPSTRTVALKLLNTVYPIGYTLRVPNNVSVDRKFSNGLRPGNKYATPEDDATIDGTSGATSFAGRQQAPVAWLQFAASGGDAYVDVCALDPDQIQVHDSVDHAITAKADPDISLTVGESIELLPNSLFNYSEGHIDLNATSATPGNVTASVDVNTGVVTLTGVAAAASTTVTVVATTPTETSASLAMDVAVTA